MLDLAESLEFPRFNLFKVIASYSNVEMQEAP
jgi:hypothetical protein